MIGSRQSVNRSRKLRERRSISSKIKGMTTEIMTKCKNYRMKASLLMSRTHLAIQNLRNLSNKRQLQSCSLTCNQLRITSKRPRRPPTSHPNRTRWQTSTKSLSSKRWMTPPCSHKSTWICWRLSFQSSQTQLTPTYATK